MSKQGVLAHVRTVHLSCRQQPPAAWLLTAAVRLCPACWEFAPATGPCSGPRCAPAVLARAAADPASVRVQFCTTFDRPSPAGLHLMALLQAGPPVQRRVPPTASTLLARVLTIALLDFLDSPSWETLARLLIAPRSACSTHRVRAARGPGQLRPHVARHACRGHARHSTACWLPALARGPAGESAARAGISPMEARH